MGQIYKGQIRVQPEQLAQYNLAVKHLFYFMRASLMGASGFGEMYDMGNVSCNGKAYSIRLGGDTGGATVRSMTEESFHKLLKAGQSISFDCGKANENEHLILATFTLLAHFLKPQNVRVYYEAEDYFMKAVAKLLQEYTTALTANADKQKVFSAAEIAQLKGIENSFLYLYESEDKKEGTIWTRDEQRRISLPKVQKVDTGDAFSRAVILSCQLPQTFVLLNKFAQAISYQEQALSLPAVVAIKTSFQEPIAALGMAEVDFYNLLNTYLKHVSEPDKRKKAEEILNMPGKVLAGDSLRAQPVQKVPSEKQKAGDIAAAAASEPVSKRARADGQSVGASLAQQGVFKHADQSGAGVKAAIDSGAAGAGAAAVASSAGETAAKFDACM